MDFQIPAVIFLASPFCPPQLDRTVGQGNDRSGVTRSQFKQFAALGDVTLLFNGFPGQHAGLGEEFVAEEQVTVGENLGCCLRSRTGWQWHPR